jgi:hypothetical protein
MVNDNIDCGFGNKIGLPSEEAAVNETAKSFLEKDVQTGIIIFTNLLVIVQ